MGEGDKMEGGRDAYKEKKKKTEKENRQVQSMSWRGKDAKQHPAITGIKQWWGGGAVCGG